MQSGNWAPLALLLTGCGAFSHVSECRRVAETVNAANQDLQTELGKAPDAQATVYFSIGSRYKTLRQDLGRLKFRDPQFDKSVKRLSRDVNTLALEAEQYADALQRMHAAAPESQPSLTSELDGIRQRFQRDQEIYVASLDKVRTQCAPIK